MAGVDQRFVENDAITEHDAVLAVDHEPTRLVENILSVLPDTKTVFVVVGASRLEQVWLDEMKKAFRRFEGRVTFSWGNDLSFADMVTRAAHLPSHSAILFAILSVDSKGVPYVEDEALATLHASANAPIFGVRSTQLGLGIVGGPLISVEDLSQNTAEAALHLLNGEPPRTLSIVYTAARDACIRRARTAPVEHRRASPPVWEPHPVSRTDGLGAIQTPHRCDRCLSGHSGDPRSRPRGDAWKTTTRGTVAARQRTTLPHAVECGSGDALDDRWRHETHRVQPFLAGFHRRIERCGTEQRLDDVVHPDDVATCFDTYSQAFDRREPFRLECRVRRHDGEYRWILETGAPRFLADGSFAGFVGSAIDVTISRSARVALSSLNHRLMQAHERERASVAKELQDDLCQRMILLTIRLHGLSRPSDDGGDEEIPRKIETLSSEFADLASEIFAISDQLHSSKLELMGLAAVSRAFCEEVSAQHGVAVEFATEAFRTVYRTTSRCLFFM